MSIASTAAIFGSPSPSENKMATVAELRERLDAADIEYPAKATKAELEAMLPEPNDGEVKSVEQIAHENYVEPTERPPRERPTYARADIKITCMVETLDGEVHEEEISIVNPLGCIPAAYINKPDTVYQILRGGLKAKLGKNHIK